MRVARVLKPLEVQQVADVIGEHNVGGVAGTLLLVVQKTPAGTISRTWKFRSRAGGTARTFGLGSYAYSKLQGGKTVTLAEARQEAREILEALREGKDPRAKQKAKTQEESQKQKARPLDALMVQYLDECEAGHRWKSPRMRSDYARLYQNYVSPQLGQKTPDEVTAQEIARVVNPVFLHSPSTGKKVQPLLSAFFRWCLQPENGFRAMPLGNPATTEALKGRLPALGQCKAEEHHPMCPLKDLPRFVRLLVSRGTINSVGGMACLFTLLTASRQGNVIKNSRAGRGTYAVWQDIDPVRALWVIPAQKMKVSENGEHVVPLSKQALAILQRLEALGLRNGDAVFKGTSGKIVGEAACSRIIQRLSAQDKENGGTGFTDQQQGGRRMTMHGTARAAFQTWAAEQGYSRDLTEAALHHTKGGNGDAYLRTKYAEQRREMMQAWADFLFSECPEDWTKLSAA